MHQTRTGRQRVFSINCISARTKRRVAQGHRAVVTLANIHDKYSLPELFHGQEGRVWDDCAYELIPVKALGAP